MLRGNSNIENLAQVGKIDSQLKTEEYTRTKEQNRLLGLGYTQEEALEEQKKLEEEKSYKMVETEIDLFEDELIEFKKKDDKVENKKEESVDELEEKKKLENFKNRKIVSNVSIIDSELDTKKFEESITTKKEIVIFHEHCYNCGNIILIKIGKIGILRMIIANIPHFKEIILMAFSCENSDGCGMIL
jgi:hypothetical protein